MATSKNINQTDYLTFGRVYHPAKTTMDDTQRTWLTVQEILNAAENSQATRAAITEQLMEKYNHGSFVGYAIRRGWLVKA